jgi:hypothetical protein
MVQQSGGVNRSNGLRLNDLDPLSNQDQGLQGLSTKQLMELLSQFMNGQGGPQATQGGGQPSGGVQPAGGAQQAGNNGILDHTNPEEILRELQRRAELNQNEFANQLRQVTNTQQPNGAQNGFTGQLLATAPVDLGQSLNISSGGGFSGGSFA